MEATEIAALLPELLNQHKAERSKLDRVDKWMRGEPDKPHAPRQSTREYRELVRRAATPWLGLVVTSVAQALYVDGYRRSDAADDAAAWQLWQVNQLDARQIAIHRAALTYGYSFTTVLPAMLAEQPSAVIRGRSPRRMQAYYADPAADDLPVVALHDLGTKGGTHTVEVWDEVAVWTLTKTGNDKRWIIGEPAVHNLGVCPVVRYCNSLDLEGRSDGEVEPYIPTAARIDQTTFDRLVVQRFASWVVRTIAGMTPPSDADPETTKIRLRAEDLLIAEDPDTKFGSLPATQLDGFISAQKADVHALAAVSQTPAHELLGDMVNLSAEALAAARASQTAKVDERKHLFGESHEQMLRLAALAAGNTDGAQDYSAQVRWRDTEIRSLAQAADALGKLATMLGIPAEILWEKVPGLTDQDIERAKVLAQEQGGLAELLRSMSDNTASSLPAAPAA